MNHIQSSILLVAFLFSLIACEKENDIQPSDLVINNIENTISILPLGDSRVEGNRPNFESYRYELWKKLVAQDLNIDFVGTRLDDNNYPDFMGQSFDRDHQGTGGAETSDIFHFVNNLKIDATLPSIVLLGIGGNDLTDGQKTVTATIENINQIIDALQTRNPQITILLEQIAPARSDFLDSNLTTLLHQFNAAIVNIGLTQTDENSKVIIVDMASNWSDEYMADAVHYNEAGAKEVAGRYFEAMEMILGE